MSAAQGLEKLEHHASDFLAFLYQNVLLLVVIAAGYLLTRLAAAIVWKAVLSKNGSGSTRWLPIKPFYLTYGKVVRHLPRLAILFLSFTFFKFIIVTLLTNTIKTDKVPNKLLSFGFG